VFSHASALGSWDETLTGSMQGVPPPLRPRQRGGVSRPPAHP
jgi:hypothetical protein